MKPARVAHLVLLLLGLTACGDDSTKRTIEGLAVVDNGGSMVAVGGTTKVTVSATFADGTTEDYSDRAVWNTYLGSTLRSAREFATVDGTGIVTGVSEGTYNVVADVYITDDHETIRPYSGRITIGFTTVAATTGDGGTPDSSTPDASTPDASTPDSSMPDADTSDGAASDAAAGDAA